jgi:enoyl-CoA hydratase
MAVHFEVDAQIATITIDRPEARNSIDQATAHAISVSVGKADADPEVRVIVITGAGGYFCAGMDLKAFLRGEVVRSPTNGFAGVTQRVLKKPFIAAVEGYALAGGFEIALACDMIVAAEDARFGLSETKRGLVPNAGGLVRLPRQIPPKIAAELIMTAEMVSSTFLASHGLVNRVVPRGQALSAARELAAKIAANDPLAIEVSKRVLNESQDWLASEMFERQNAITAPVFVSASALAGALQFANKAEPAPPKE